VASLTNLQKLTTESAAWNTKYNALQTKNPKKEEKKQVEKKEEKKQVEIN
jgi:hypothetical protein